ncbi:MAG: diacylglycerol kinase [Sphingobacteriales bacterium SCN 48-20]|uniref:dihydrofolate reductase n=1 Tax=Terrimonas ferruginea TaxID=249 RepID=UPI0004060AA6|nr:dihydrofolate reductase [Terrimonas ferruginea]MBN8783964.1 dihydrofolate reductase [Terrimonas ferruginea]ODT94207.1 MAG: diacylglycerol kinase [Sphingobacteriales bacterium SCN 48-20]OJW41725.1 MAG: diacylglycerol kinase [Sphingobacteriales bacterium 48-107]
MNISLVVAAADNNIIGKDNQLLWHLPNDLKFFKNVTWGMPVIMGRKTFEALGKPLAGRKNIVITRQKGWKAEGAVVVGSLDDALFLVKEMDVKEPMVIGGGEIYRLAFEKARRIYITRVEATPEGDTSFPAIDPAKWKLVSQKNHEADEKHAYNYSFQVWERI